MYSKKVKLDSELYSKEKVAAMKMQLKTSKENFAQGKKANGSLMKARKGAWPDCLLSAPEQEAAGAKGY
jgi:hypothetical protein